MFQLILLMTIGGIALGQDNCGKCDYPIHMDELNCLGQSDDSDGCCPVQFECPKIERTPNMCWHKGRTYNAGDKIPSNKVSPCKKCMCNAGINGAPARINCLFTDCPEFTVAARKSDCVTQFSLDKCCRTGEICGDERNNLTACEYRGHNITRGSRFYPHDAVCYECVCNEDFVDNKEPADQPKSCRKMNCPFQSYLDDIDKFCAFVYTQDGCCPIAWKCPTESDVKIIKAEPPATRSDLKCKFGVAEVAYGDSVDVDDACMNCTCKYPPYITCTKDTIEISCL